LKQNVGRGHTGTLTFVEEMFSVMISQFYPCKNAEVFGHGKDTYHTEVPRYNSESQDNHTMGKKPLYVSL